jgi:hypothetical protein
MPATDYQKEWSQDQSVKRAMENITNGADLETVLRTLWEDGSAHGYNYG